MKTVIASLIAGLAFALPTVASAQDNGNALAHDARYCQRLEQAYVDTHPAARLSDGSIDQKVDCLGDPEGGIADLTSQMQEENMAVPPRP
jgi:hypothetical protein